jgi:hypothetical protein
MHPSKETERRAGRMHPLLQGLIAGILTSVLFACAAYAMDYFNDAGTCVADFAVNGFVCGFLSRFLGAISALSAGR